MKIRYFIFTMIWFLFTTIILYSKEVKVLPNIPNTLFNAVVEADSGDILILEEGGFYPNSESLPVQVPVTIKAEKGFYFKPILLLIKNDSGEYPENMINANASLTLINIIADGQQGTMSPYSGRFINRGNIGKGGKIHVDGVEVSRFRAVSMGGDVDTLICENSLFNGNLAKAGSWGGTWDFMGDIIEYAKIQNNTFMFCTFGPFINNFWGAYLRYQKLNTLIIDHNTFYNISGAHGPTTMVNNTVKVQITNNLYINGTFRPLEFFSDKYIDFLENYDTIFPYSDISHLGPKGGWIIRASMCDTANTQIDMRNNNISFTSDLLASWISKGLEKPWIYTNETKMSILDTNSAYFEEELVFNDAPDLPMFAIDSIALHCAIGNADTAAYKGYSPYYGWEWWNPDMSPTFDYRSREEMDMRYNRDSKSFTAGDDGYPLGDLNWWPEWDPNDIENLEIGLIYQFDLTQNYPNPFNPSTKINYTLQKAAKVKLTIYNTLGQVVQTLVNGKNDAGLYSISWDGRNAKGNQVVSGIYLYRLEAGQYHKTKKMLYLK